MTLRFLLLEDSTLDKELIDAQLIEGEILCELVQVETRPEFEAALTQQYFDLILSDYALPNFDGISALAIAQQLCPETPFIFVTATMGEELAIETLKQGATDYVLKQRLQRLVPSVKRALREAQERCTRRQAEAELHRREQEFRALVENSPDIVARLDKDLRHIYINPAIKNPTTLTPEFYLGKTNVELGFTDQLCAYWDEKMRQVFATGQVGSMEFSFPAPDGLRYYQAQIVPEFTFSGSIESILVVSRDVTAYKKAEQALREQKEELERVNRIKDEFLAVLSHELRSPLNAILGWANLLQTQQFDEATTTRAIETIARNAKLQTQLIEDLLDISRIIRGKLILESQPTNLASVILAAIDVVRLSAEAKGIDLYFEGQQNNNSAPLVLGDFSRLQQIIWNLLTNAIKFTPNGGRVEVRLSLAKPPQPSEPASRGTAVSSYLSLVEDNEQKTNDKSEAAAAFRTYIERKDEKMTNYAEITVTDTGKGISADFIPYIFDSFRQADGSTTRRFGGLGLGLAIARHLVELHGGTISATSLGEEQGATFSVKLPLLKTETSQNCTSSSSVSRNTSTPNTPQSLSDLRILVVDDESDSCDFISFVLKQHGALVTSAMSAQSALQIFSSFHPDILVSDIGMPEESGYSLIRKIRLLSREQGGQIPAIALTAYARDCDRDEAIAAGFHIHQAKPIIPKDLISSIVQLKLGIGTR